MSTPQSAVSLYAHATPGFENRLEASMAVLSQAARDWRPLKQASSLGAEDMVLTHLMDTLGLDIPVFVLETGALHGETLALLERLRARRPVEVWRPDVQAVSNFVAREGSEAMYRSLELRKACCAIRKLEPLSRALAGQRAWITGLRRDQSGARADVAVVDRSEARVKINPLADWSWADVWHYIRTHRVDHNALHDQFFPSIGCAPCTRAIAVGEDFRAGRWWWEQDRAKECGLHTQAASEAAKVSPLNAITPHGARA